MNVCWEIFWVFCRLSFISLGGVFGVLPDLEHELVSVHGWMTHERFLQAYSAGSFVPGPNMAMCPLIGYWVAGIPGWCAAFLGIYVPPIFMMGAAHAVYSRARALPVVQRIEIGLRPVIVGLLVAAGLHIFWVQTFVPPRSGAPDFYPWLARPAALALLGVVYRLMRRWKQVDPVLWILGVGSIWVAVELSLIAATRA